MITEATKWLAAEVSADDADFRRRFHGAAEQVRMGLMSHGYARHDRRQDRYAVSESGYRMLDAVDRQAETATDGTEGW